MKYLFYLFLTIFSLYLNAQSSLTGKISLEPEWDSKVYISRITSLADLYRCSEQMIIAEAQVDPEGGFQVAFPTNNYPEIVRIHVSKMGAPAAMLIIGSDEENHGFYIVEPGVDYQIIKDTTCDNYFSDYAIEDPLNREFRHIDEMVNYWNLEYQSLTNKAEKERVQWNLVNQLFQYSDTSAYLLACIYALDQADMGYNHVEVNKRMRWVADRLGFHPYLNNYLKEKNDSKLYFLTMAIILLVTGPGIYLLIDYYKKQKSKQKVNSLSPREKRVALLLTNGKSNKEIASALHVEVSTVKSHIYKIFNKLDIDSRKEIIKFGSYLHRPESSSDIQ